MLHLGTSNYCWFADPSRALCLKLAGTPAGDKPLIGMCDSARCPQATHHPCHRPVWAEHAENTKTFLGQLGRAQKTERARLQAEYDRADPRPGPDRRGRSRRRTGMRLSRQQLAGNEAKIRAAMTRLLDGDIPPGGKCDIKTLAGEASVDRTAFYGTRPYAHLRTEFEQRLRELLDAGERPDPRDAQATRLKDEITRLKERLARSDATISELAGFRDQALARLAAQHHEITRLRQEVRLAAGVRRPPVPPIQEQNPS